MAYFRVTLEGYREIECESEEEAIQDFIDFVENDGIDSYGRTWRQLIDVEKLSDE